MFNKRIRVINVGPSLSTQGGISTVLKIYKEKMNIYKDGIFIETYSGKSRIIDIVMFFTAIIKITAICIRFGLDKELKTVFHIHTASKGSFFRKSIIAKVCIFFKHYVVFHIHGGGFQEFIESSSDKKKAKILFMLKKASMIVVLSYRWKKYFLKYIEDYKIKVIYNPVSTLSDRIKNVDDEIVKILFVGRMSRKKGTYDLIEAVGRIKSKKYRLELYGDGDVAGIRELIRKKKIDNVKVSEWVSQDTIEKVYRSAQLLVLPSYAEGLPMSILEAIGHSTAIIATDVGGIPEAVVNNRNGFLTKPGDIKSLYHYIEKLVLDHQLRRDFCKESFKIANEKFKLEKIEEGLMRVYEAV